MTDTGNACRLIGGNCLPPPYGETYFHQPNGRWCDGRMIVDFIAQAYGLPTMPPSMGGNTPDYFKHGANFAVAAARALNNSAYKRVTGMDPPGDDHSLGVQLQSFKDLLPIISQGSNFPAPLYACCGGPGPYNVSATISCGAMGSQSCPNPENYVTWDNVHLTEAANHAIANGILYGPFAIPPLPAVAS
ncbi:hypothetical protein LUZ61_012741 [Rhynchospora tenuis]|uniref:GDSL esterase/lipase n=1 Tax=Rhynchospora tenuis TaxID=198213 RepID=A0AAD6A3G5_9POAL|nr:hypothetical protein LUZ61_012741 [Rhynchospora tenuis]